MVSCSCGQAFSVFPALFAHQKATGHYYCQQCGKNFAQDGALQQHRSACPTLECNTCGKKFCHAAKLRSHQLLAEHCCCKACNMCFATQEKLEQHRATTHPACGACGQKYQSEEVLRVHQRSSQHCYCKFCNQFFLLEKELRQHHSVHHSFGCNTCSRQFVRVERLRDHQRSTGHLYCGECNQYFVKAGALEQHVKSSHPSQFHCCDCELDFRTLEALNQHLQTKVHSPKKVKPLRFSCSPCDRHFKSQSALDQHLGSLVHKPLSDIQCIASTHCKGRFTSPSALLHHLESGACCSGMTAKKLNLLVQSNDVDRVISTGLTARDGLLPPIQSPVSDSHSPLKPDYDSDSDSELSTGGVPIFTPTSSGNGNDSPLFPNTQQAAFSSSRIANLLSNTNLPSPPPNQLSIITTLFCPLCPSTRAPFSNLKALKAHLASPKHAPKIFRCPTTLLLPAPSSTTPPKAQRTRFSTLSGLAQHVESGVCTGGKAGLRFAVGIVEERLRAMGFKSVGLLRP